MVEGGMTCIKYIIFVFNLLFVLVACVLIGIGTLVQVTLAEYYDFFGNEFAGPGIVLIIVGLVIFVVATCGCCGALKENYCFIMTFAVLLGFIFVVLLAAGIGALIYKNKVKDVTERILQRAEPNYPKNEGVERTWDHLQQQFECCGVKDYTEWFTILNNTVPVSCCVDKTSTECENRGTVIDDKNFYTQGCVDVFLVDWLQSEMVLVAGIGIGLAFFEILGIIFACCLASAIRKEYKVL